MMTLDEFTSYVKNHVVDFLPVEYKNAEIKVDTLYKANDIQRPYLSVVKKDDFISTVVYLDEYYNKYVSINSLRDVMHEIADICRTDIPLEFRSAEANLSDYNYVKDHLQMRICEIKSNQNRLMNLAYVEPDAVPGFAATFAVDVGNGGFAQITNNMLYEYGVTATTLYNDALLQTNSRFSSLFETLSCMMADMDVPNHIDDETYDQNEVYVLTNTSSQFGASCLFDSKVMNHISERMGGDLYIIPSSVHEVLIIAANSEVKPAELGFMLREVNREEVSSDDFLSDSLLEYNSKEKKISIINEPDEELKEPSHKASKRR